jgi:hypothetical protein
VGFVSDAVAVTLASTVVTSASTMIRVRARSESNGKTIKIGVGPVGRERQRHTHYRTGGADERDQRGQLIEAEREHRRADAAIG